MKTQDNIYGSEDTRELLNPTFTEASSRANIESGESHKTIFGKIKKFFTDLKTVAFTGAYSDLSGTPTLSTVATSGKYSDLSGKPTLGDLAAKSTDSSTSHYLRGDGKWVTPPDTNTWRPLGTGASDACAGNDSRLSNSRPASDVYSWAKAASKPSYTYSEVGAAASSHDHDGTYLKLSGGTMTGGITTTANSQGKSLQVLGGSIIFYKNGGYEGYIYHGNNNDTRIDAQTTQFYVTGSVSAAGFNDRSSLRYKENISDLTEEEALKILDVRPVIFDYKQIEHPEFQDPNRTGKRGVIAEEVAKIMPEVVSYIDLDGETVPDGVTYSEFIPYLIKMVQMQQAEIEELKKKVNL